jgi:hypothetical protein
MHQHHDPGSRPNTSGGCEDLNDLGGAAPTGRRLPAQWVAGFAAVLVLIASAVAIGINTTGTSETSSLDTTPTTSTLSRVSASTSVTDLLARPSDFPPIGDNRYDLSDPSQNHIPARSGPLDACDRLMWPEKEYPDLVHRSAYYDPPSEHGGQSMTATVYMRELPALGPDFDTTVNDCPGFDTQLTEFSSSSESIGTAIDRTTLAALDIPGVDGEHHGYRVSEVHISSSGPSSTSPDEHRLVGILRGVTFVVSVFDGRDLGAAAIDRDLATLFNNQRHRILGAP